MSRTMKVSMVVVSLFVIGVCLSLQTTISEEKMDEEITAAVEKFLTAFNSIVTRCITDLRAVLFLGGFFIDDERELYAWGRNLALTYTWNVSMIFQLLNGLMGKYMLSRMGGFECIKLLWIMLFSGSCCFE